MTEQQPEQIMAEKIARLTAKVEQLREFIRTYTAIECRGQTYYPEWAERALRD
jgi:acyl carrier protein phosphodiesterase